MGNKLKILFVIFFVLLSESVAELDDIISDEDFLNNMLERTRGAPNPATSSNKDNKGNPTDGEIGIVGTLAGVYNKSREAVKSVYDEIQYWKGIGATYGMLKDWYDDQKKKYRMIRRTVGKLTSNPKHVFSNLQGKDWFETALNYMDSPLALAGYYTGTAESIVNQTDDFSYGGIRNLDKIFSHAEKYIDSVGDSKISGMLMPNTDEVFAKFDEMIYTSPMDTSYKKRIMSETNYKRFSSEKKEIVLDSSEFKKQQETKVQAMEEFVDRNNELFVAAQVDKFPETKIINIVKGLTASATGNSAMYYSWSMSSMERLNQQMEELDLMFAADKLNNIMDLQLLAAKLELEMINANNKRILHELEALKIHHAMLGYEIWKHSKTKAQDESLIGDVLTLRQIALENLQDTKERLKEKYGDENYGVKYK
jgi:hypothetical protein